MQFTCIANTNVVIIIINGYNDYHAADCGVPSVNRNIKLNFSSTLEGAVLILTCDNYLTSNTNVTDQQSLTVICHSNTTIVGIPIQLISLSLVHQLLLLLLH